MNAVPMAFVRELARRKVRDLTLVAIVARDAGRMARRRGLRPQVISGLVSLEGFGLAPRVPRRGPVRRGRDRGVQRAHADLPAAGRGLRPAVRPDEGRARDRHARPPPGDDARGGRRGDGRRPTSSARALPVDVAIVHADAADTRGNVRVDPKLVWMDSELVKAAARVIVTVERILPERAFRAAPERTTYPRFAVDTVVEAPWGAYPTSSYPTYGYDGAFFEAYQRAHADPAPPPPSGRSGSRARDARARSSTRTAARRRCCGSPGGRRERPRRSTS